MGGVVLIKIKFYHKYERLVPAKHPAGASMHKRFCLLAIGQNGCSGGDIKIDVRFIANVVYIVFITQETDYPPAIDDIICIVYIIIPYEVDIKKH